MDKEIIRRTVRHAVEMVDGYQQLAGRLRVTKSEVKAWVDGTRVPGPMALLRILELIMHEAGKLSDDAMAMALAEAVIAKAQQRSRA